MDPAEIEDLFEQLEDLSDSGPDVDTISIGSTPKPSLKPFFNSSRSLLQQQQHHQHQHQQLHGNGQQHSECRSSVRTLLRNPEAANDCNILALS